MSHHNNTSDTILTIRAADLYNILAPKIERKGRHLPVPNMWPIIGSPGIFIHTRSYMRIIPVI